MNEEPGLRGWNLLKWLRKGGEGAVCTPRSSPAAHPKQRGAGASWEFQVSPGSVALLPGLGAAREWGRFEAAPGSQPPSEKRVKSIFVVEPRKEWRGVG